MWFQGGQQNGFKSGYYVVSTGHHKVSTWTPCVVEVTTWKPVQKTALHEANWLPCLSCINLIPY